MQNGKLLVVGDDPQVCEALRHIAELCGYEVMTTNSEIAFFEQLALFEPELIIVDVVKGPPEGLAVFDRLAELDGAVRLIVVTALGQHALEEIARIASQKNLPVLGTLEKPFSAQRLRQLLSLHGAAAEEQGTSSDSWLNHISSDEPIPSTDDLVSMIENDRITLRYLPKVACSDGSLMGFEALARWDIPGKGTVTPSVFVPMAESSNLIEALTHNTIRHGIRWFGELRSTPTSPAKVAVGPGHLQDLTLSFNVSARVLPDMDLAGELDSLCAAHSVPSSSIILEISESNTMRDPRHLKEILDRLRSRGYQLSIDDFGTGFSSMLHLVRLPFNELKIDRTFVSEAASHEEARSVVRCTVDLAHSLGMTTVAEGVETDEVRRILVGYGCDAYQGYLVSPPIAAGDVGSWLQRYRSRPVS